MQREKEREKEGLTDAAEQQRERERRESRRVSSSPTPDAAARSCHRVHATDLSLPRSPRCSGEIASSSSQFEPPISLSRSPSQFTLLISLFLNLCLPFQPGLIVADLLDRRSLSCRFAFSPITLSSICSLTDLLDL